MAPEEPFGKVALYEGKRMTTGIAATMTEAISKFHSTLSSVTKS